MALVVQSLAPIFFLILIGYALKHYGILPAPLWEGIDRLSYYVLFPMLILVTLIQTDFNSVPVFRMGLVMAGSITLMTALVLVLRPFLKQRYGIGGPAFSSFYQGAARWNTFAAIAVIGNLFGAQGIALSSIGVVAMTPYLNLLSITVVAYSSGRSLSKKQLVAAVAKNPFVLATALGIFINLAEIPLWLPLMETANALGKAALAVGLLCVGGGLNLRDIVTPRMEVALASALKLGVMPLFMAGLGWLCGLEGLALQVAILCGSVQTASNSYILARQMGGDAPLMATIISAQTVVVFITLPCVLWLLS